MTPDDAFLRTIIENLDDDTARLVYADWLDEQGHSDRAEFIRLHCHLRRLTENDPRRQELETRKEQLLWVAHRENWLQQFGVAMTWENAISLFRCRLAETIAWCRGREVPFLRTPALEPASLLGRVVPARAGQHIWRAPSTAEREAIVNDLANRRAMLLLGEGRPAQTCDRDLAGGRLLLFDPDCSLSDGAATPASDGFFDEHNVPAWDTWVWYTEDRSPQQGGWMPFASYLVAWVPAHLLERADGGIRVNPEECIRWASDIDTVLTRQLRDASLLA